MITLFFILALTAGYILSIPLDEISRADAFFAILVLVAISQLYIIRAAAKIILGQKYEISSLQNRKTIESFFKSTLKQGTQDG